MALIPLTLVTETNTFGTTVKMVNTDKKYEVVLAEYLEEDPFLNMTPSLTDGYIFRSPDIHQDDWKSMLETLSGIDGAFSITAELQRKKDHDDVVVGYARFEEKSDAAVFAWMNVENWQKWDAVKEEEYRKSLKARTPKHKVNADGTVRVKVTMESLDD